MADPVSKSALPSDTLAHELRGFAAKLRRLLRTKANVGDLTPTQSAVLLRLEREGAATTSGLARAEGMRPQSMGTIIAALEAGGLVHAHPDPSDGRQTLLSLTPKCRAWLQTGREARQDWLSGVIQSRLSSDERDFLLSVLPLLRRLVDD